LLAEQLPEKEEASDYPDKAEQKEDGPFHECLLSEDFIPHGDDIINDRKLDACNARVLSPRIDARLENIHSLFVEIPRDRERLRLSPLVKSHGGHVHVADMQERVKAQE
jgi:hypothetical protein